MPSSGQKYRIKYWQKYPTWTKVQRPSDKITSVAFTVISPEKITDIANINNGKY